MIKELFHWLWAFIWHLITFQWGHLGYHWKNLWWYLCYGYTYSDLMDTDLYLLCRIREMADMMAKYTHSYPPEMSMGSYKRELLNLASICGDLMDPDLQYDKYHEARKKVFFNKFQKLFFWLWF